MTDRALLTHDRAQILRVAPASDNQLTTPIGEKSFWVDIVEDEKPPLGPGERYVESVELIDGVPHRVWRTEAIDYQIPERRTEAIAEVNRQAGECRKTFATYAPLQDIVYEAKRREAERYVSDLDPQPEHYPFLAAEVGITADNLAGVAAVVNEKAQAWSLAAAAIERVRLAAIDVIEAVADDAGAEGVAAIEAVLAGLTWPTLEE